MIALVSQLPARKLYPNSPAGQPSNASKKSVGELALEIRMLIQKLGNTPYIELRPLQTEPAMRARFEISDRLWGRMETFDSLHEKARSLGKSDSLPFLWDQQEADAGRLQKIAEGLRGEMHVLDGLLRNKASQRGEFQKIPVLESAAPGGEWGGEKKANLVTLALSARSVLRWVEKTEGWESGQYRNVDVKIRQAMRQIHNLRRSLRHYEKFGFNPEGDNFRVMAQAGFLEKAVRALDSLGIPYGELQAIFEKIIASAPKGMPEVRDERIPDADHALAEQPTASSHIPDAEKAPIVQPAALQAPKPTERETILLQNAYISFGRFHNPDELEPYFIKTLLKSTQLTENAARAVWEIGQLAIGRDSKKITNGEYERGAVEIIRARDERSQEKLYFYGTGIHSF